MKYERQGLLAIAPEAFGAEYETTASNGRHAPNNIAVVPIVGPLDHHKHPFFDSYEAITQRIEAACASSAGTIVLAFDSPGGVVSGLFETVTTLKALASSHNKRLVAYVEGSCCSAAYALACACDEIVTCSTGIVGSIGVIDARLDISAANSAMGVRVAFITSGSTKAYGHPDLALTDAELADRQRVVDDLAGVFFGHVQTARGVDPRPLDARVFVGESAVTQQLADRTSTYSDLLLSLANQPQELLTMTYAELLGALTEMAKGDDEDAAKAKAALAAMEDKEESDGESTPDASAEGDDEDEKRDDEEPEASTVAQLAAQVQALSEQLKTLGATKEQEDRKAFFASRPDLSKELVEVLASKPLAEVKAIVNAMPRKANRLGAAVTPAGTRGATQGERASSGPAMDRIDALMGMGSAKSTSVVQTEHSTILGAPKGYAPRGN